jgi:hypothetical protein
VYIVDCVVDGSIGQDKRGAHGSFACLFPRSISSDTKGEYIVGHDKAEGIDNGFGGEIAILVAGGMEVGCDFTERVMCGKWEC